MTNACWVSLLLWCAAILYILASKDESKRMEQLEYFNLTFNKYKIPGFSNKIFSARNYSLPSGTASLFTTCSKVEENIPIIIFFFNTLTLIPIMTRGVPQ